MIVNTAITACYQPRMDFSKSAMYPSSEAVRLFRFLMCNYNLNFQTWTSRIFYMKIHRAMFCFSTISKITEKSKYNPYQSKNAFLHGFVMELLFRKTVQEMQILLR